MSRNADVHAPTAKARDRIAAAEVVLFFASCLQAKTESARTDSIDRSVQAIEPTDHSNITTLFTSPPHWAKGASSLDRIPTVIDSFLDVRFKFLFDFTRQAIDPEHIGNAGP